VFNTGVEYIERMVNSVRSLAGPNANGIVRRAQIRAAACELAAESGLRAITIRRVAQRAGLSTGLVLFHYGTKQRLVLGVLDWVLETTTALCQGPAVVPIEAPHQRLLALLRQEMTRLAKEPGRTRVFFEFWSAGLCDPVIGTRMKQELDRYRQAFLPLAEAVLADDKEFLPSVTPYGLAAVIVSFIKGCSVQSLIEPELNLADFVNAAEGLLSAGAGLATAIGSSCIPSA
jgi:AcrR family transcriptional regulator